MEEDEIGTCPYWIIVRSPKARQQDRETAFRSLASTPFFSLGNRCLLEWLQHEAKDEIRFQYQWCREGSLDAEDTAVVVLMDLFEQAFEIENPHNWMVKAVKSRLLWTVAALYPEGIAEEIPDFIEAPQDTVSDSGDANHCPPVGNQVLRGQDLKAQDIGRPTLDLLMDEGVPPKKAAMFATAIDALPRLQREAFRLFAVIHFSQKEGAEILKISYGAFRVNLYRARQHLRDYGMGESEA